MADQSKSSEKKPIPSYKPMSIQEEYAMLTTPKSTSTSSETRDLAPAPSFTAEGSQATPFAQIFPGQPGNPIDADHPPALIPTSILAEMVGLPMPSRRSRRMRNISPGDIPPAIPRSQSGPRRPTPLERMNLVDTENIGTDSDDEDYVPPTSANTSSFLPELSPEEIEAINAAVTPSGDAAPATVEVPADNEAPVADNVSVPAGDQDLHYKNSDLW
ncbi:hypothetical protein CASFOL_022651 [Castilleja foliolosa]|uniref:Uncharacterized protein n=1 Tax=Castilleja foliolosa TaxID=1961234 RepID=A0ABD3CXS9_9LAMI